MASSKNGNGKSSSKAGKASQSKDSSRGYELCPRCGKIVHYSSIGRHMREVHGGEKKYVCPVDGCGAAFYRAQQLDEVSFQAPVCQSVKAPQVVFVLGN